MGGVDNVLVVMVGRSWAATHGSDPSSRRPTRESAAREARWLASTMPAVNGGSVILRSRMAAIGSDSGAAVNCCILVADRRLTPSGLLVLVLDLLRAFATVMLTVAGSGAFIWAEV